jgi:hypothetical protein
MDNAFQKVVYELQEFVNNPNAFRSVLILILTLFVAFWLSEYIAKIFVYFAQKIAVRSDNTDDAEKKVQLRRVETYLSVSTAIIRALFVGSVTFFIWQALSGHTSFSAAAIGASAFFAVLIGGTLGMILRDLTAGAAMVIERWFNVGDFIRVLPWDDVSGVVEHMTLRSTKIRHLNGEEIWIHNQHIQGVRVTPHGQRRMAIDIFVNNQAIGKGIIEKAIETVPVSTLTAIETPRIDKSEKWGERLWLFTVIGKTAPGREWIFENYFVESLQELDEKRKGPKTLVRPPLVRFADRAAEGSFKRAVRR